MPEWQDLFAHLFVPDVSLVEKVVRPILVYLFLILTLRFLGRRELAQLNSGDFVVLLLLSNTIQNAIIGPDDVLLGGLVGALALLGVNGALIGILYRNPRWARWFEGRPIVLVRNGRLMRPELRRLVLSEGELHAALRRQGAQRLADVQLCTLDLEGNLIVELKPDAAGGQTAELARVREQLAAVLRQLQAVEARLDQPSGP